MSLEHLQIDPYFLAKIFTQPIIPGEKPAVPATVAEETAAAPNVLETAVAGKPAAPRVVAAEPDRPEATHPETSAPKVAEAPAAALPPVKFLGENQRKIALLINNPDAVYLNDEHFNLLTNILNACKLGMQDVALINLHAYPGATFGALQQAIPMQQCIFFGIAPESIALQGIQPYQVAQAGATSVLYSHELAVIASDKTMKGRLWNSLKQLLGI